MKKLTSFFLAALMCLSLITFVPPAGNDDEPPEPPEITDIVPKEPDNEDVKNPAELLPEDGIDA